MRDARTRIRHRRVPRRARMRVRSAGYMWVTPVPNVPKAASAWSVLPAWCSVRWWSVALGPIRSGGFTSIDSAGPQTTSTPHVERGAAHHQHRT